jgi:hypothetical protein
MRLFYKEENLKLQYSPFSGFKLLFTTRFRPEERGCYFQGELPLKVCITLFSVANQYTITVFTLLQGIVSRKFAMLLLVPLES